MHRAARLRRSILFAAVSSAVLATHSALAVDRNWTNSAGGSFEIGGNWSGGVMPGNGDNAVFNLNANYTVTFAAPHTNLQCIVNRDRTTLGLGGFTYSVTGLMIANVNANDIGSLTVSNGVLSVSGFVAMGSAAGMVGNLTIDAGASASLGVATLGLNGSGTATATSGGDVSSPLVTLGSNATGAGTINVLGAGSTWTVSGGALVVAQSGAGTVNIDNGGTMSCNAATLGLNAGANGTILVNGNGSKWTNSAPTAIGSAGAGTLNLTNGAFASTAGATLGVSATGSGSISATGASTLSLSQPMTIGALGNGVVTISNSTLTAPAVTLGSSGSGRGQLTVTGPTALANVSAMSIGSAGIGTMLVNAGAKGSATSITLGGGLGSSGAMTVDGFGTIWSCPGAFTAGDSGAATLTVSNGAELSVGSLVIAGSIGSAGTVAISGAGSRLSFNDALYVGGIAGGGGGTARLSVGTGATCTGPPGTSFLKLWTPGTVDLAGGTLSVGTFDTSGGGAFNWSAGTLALTGAAGAALGAGPLPPTLSLGSSRALLVTNTATISAGKLLAMDGGYLAAGSLQNSGELLLRDRLSTVQASNGLTNSGLIDGDGRITAALLNNPSGEVRISAAQRITFDSASGHTSAGQINLFDGTLETIGLLTTGATGRIAGRGLLVAHDGIDNHGTFAFSAGITDVFGTVNNAAGSKVVVTGGNTTTFFDAVTNDPSSQIIVSTGSTIVFLSEVAGLGPFSGPGTKHFQADASGAGINTISGTTIVGPQAHLQTTRVRDGTLRIDGTVSMLPDGSASAVNRIASLEITGGASAPVGTLDLSDNDLIATATPRSLIESQIVYARHGGQWDRAGLTSSAARSEPMRLTMLGVLSGAEYKSVYGSFATFDGFAVADADVLVKYTLYGDSDFNDRIDGADYARIDSGFNDVRSGWINGDFDLNGKVDGADYALIDISFNAQSGTLPIMLGFLDGSDPDRGRMLTNPALRTALLHFDRFGESYAIAALTSIPEPCAVPIIVIGLAAHRLRRRRVR